MDDENNPDLPDFVSDVFPVDLVLDLAFVPEDLDSDDADLLPLLEEEPSLFEEGLELDDADVPKPVLPWLLEPVLPWLDELMSEPLWLEEPDDRPLDMLPDWLED